MRSSESSRRRRKIWVQQVAVEARVLETRLRAAEVRGQSAEQREVAAGITELLDSATKAADRKDPVPSRILNWWRGVLVDAAYRNLHAARAQMLDLVSEEELDAEIPGIIARAHTGLSPDDPRCISQTQLTAMPMAQRRARAKVLAEDGYEAVDLKHDQLRSFRNIILMAAAVIIVLISLTTVWVSLHPTAMPLCFPTRSPRRPTRP